MAYIDSVSNSELRIVLIGGRDLHLRPSYKSATGNIILGKSVFDTSTRTAQSVVRQQEVHGRKVTVVDTPGWWWHYPLENTPKLDQLEIKNSIYLCNPGPHVFLLVIPFPVHSVFLEVFKLSLEEHLNLFNEEVFNRTIVLFTALTQRTNINLENAISKWPALMWILKQCGNRSHIINIKNSQDSTQVKNLLEKIEAMVAKNGGGHYSPDRATGDALRGEMQALAERALKRFVDVQTERKKLKALIEGGKTPPQHLRLVMVGAQWSAKSSAGNTILRNDKFSVCNRRTTEYCEINHGLVAGRKITLVDSPGWYYNHTLHDTCEMNKLQIANSVYMCAPGPHAVLLVVGLASAFNASYQRSIQEHMSLFRDEIWKHTIVLFTRGDWLGVKTVEERIESEKDLQWLVEKCGNRYHVLDNRNHHDETQVTELLAKIEEMWIGNTDPYYEVDLGLAEQMEARKKAEDKMAKRIRQMTQRQSRILRELFRGEEKEVTEVKLVLVGKKESGKSMAGNRILLEELFDTSLMKKEFHHNKGSTVCVKHHRGVAESEITVVEAPGWLGDLMPSKWLKDEVLHSVSMCAPGPHVFMLVIPICKAFTEKDLKALLELLTPLGENVWRYCMVLFTWEDWLNNRSIEDHIASEGKPLQQLVQKCKNRYHVVTCRRFCGGHPANELFQKITDIITQNRGKCFTAGDKQEKKLKLSWKAKQLTEEQWNRREQELIDRMLKALAQEPEDPTLLPVNITGSLDGAFIPSMSSDAPTEYGGPIMSQKVHAKVSNWLNIRDGISHVTSGISSMRASATYAEELDDDLSKCFSSERDKINPTSISTDSAKTQHRHSF